MPHTATAASCFSDRCQGRQHSSPSSPSGRLSQSINLLVEERGQGAHHAGKGMRARLRQPCVRTNTRRACRTQMGTDARCACVVPDPVSRRGGSCRKPDGRTPPAKALNTNSNIWHALQKLTLGFRLRALSRASDLVLRGTPSSPRPAGFRLPIYFWHDGRRHAHTHTHNFQTGCNAPLDNCPCFAEAAPESQCGYVLGRQPSHSQ